MRTVVKCPSADASPFSDRIIEDDPDARGVISFEGGDRAVYAYLAGRFLIDSVTLYSFSAALHSVLTSSDRGNCSKNACSAAWMASAMFSCKDRRRLRMSLVTSIQKPVVSLSHAGVSTSTASRIVLFLDVHILDMHLP